MLVPLRALLHASGQSWKFAAARLTPLSNFGVDELLPPQIQLLHGPGCPVCVTPVELIDKVVEIAARPDVIFTSFGDMLRVPGTRGDLLSASHAAAMCASSIRHWMRSS